MRVGDVDDSGKNGEKLGNLSGAATSGSCDDLKALVVGANGDGLNQAVVLDALGKLIKLGVVKGLLAGLCDNFTR